MIVDARHFSVPQRRNAYDIHVAFMRRKVEQYYVEHTYRVE
jgi:hypothetical protein